MTPLRFNGLYDISYLSKPCACPYSVWLSGEVFGWCYGSPCFDYVQSREGGILVSIACEAKHNDFANPTLMRVKALGDTVWINVAKEVGKDGFPYLIVSFPHEGDHRSHWRWPPQGAHRDG